MNMVLSVLVLLVSLCTLTPTLTTNAASINTQHRLRSKLTANAPITPNLAQLQADHPFDTLPHMSMYDYHESAQLPGDDVFSQVRSIIDQPADNNKEDTLDNNNDEEDTPSSFVETGVQVGKVRSFCEICILVMQMKERGQPHLCAGLNTNYHITCIEVLESLLRADKAIV
jgi:hypothetical protein